MCIRDRAVPAPSHGSCDGPGHGRMMDRLILGGCMTNALLFSSLIVMTPVAAPLAAQVQNPPVGQCRVGAGVECPKVSGPWARLTFGPQEPIPEVKGSRGQSRKGSEAGKAPLSFLPPGDDDCPESNLLRSPAQNPKGCPPWRPGHATSPI